MGSASALEQNHRSTDIKSAGGRLKVAGETPALLCPSPQFGSGVKMRPVKLGAKSPFRLTSPTFAIRGVKIAKRPVFWLEVGCVVQNHLRKGWAAYHLEQELVPHGAIGSWD